MLPGGKGSKVDPGNLPWNGKTVSGMYERYRPAKFIATPVDERRSSLHRTRDLTTGCSRRVANAICIAMFSALIALVAGLWVIWLKL